MTTTLDSAVTDVLNRLSDSDEKVWTRAEIELYLKDGYDTFCQRTKVLFDVYVIENLPPVGNWQTDLEKSIALTKSGWGLTDSPFHFTDDSEQNYGVGGGYGGSYAGPSGMTSPSDRTFAATVDNSAGGVPTTVPGGPLPQSTVEVLRVAYSDRDLLGFGSQNMRKVDPTYETRGGDPQFFTYDKDGFFFLRVVPAAAGDAVYDTVSGSWGTMTYTDDTAVTVVTQEVSGGSTGGFGILRHRTDMFPTEGPWGTPTRVHPATVNIKVEVHRLGRDLTSHASELPLAYQKYVVYWAMAMALGRDGNGQNTELAEHFEQRFEMGVHRLVQKRDRMTPEHVSRLGSMEIPDNFGLGEPQAPYPWGVIQ